MTYFRFYWKLPVLTDVTLLPAWYENISYQFLLRDAYSLIYKKNYSNRDRRVFQTKEEQYVNWALMTPIVSEWLDIFNQL
jgi:hypothetical protein